MDAKKREHCGLRVSEDDAKRLSDAAAYAREHFSERVTIGMLAKIACMSATKFKYSFRSTYGMTAYELITRTRMAEAERLLLEGGMTISGIALTVGYLKAGAFAAAFKKHTGMLPKHYRKSHGGQRPCDVRGKAMRSEAS
jgi:AraC-like DNA-binding protein